jgi:hypothetical protein
MNVPTGPAHVELSATTEALFAADDMYSSEALDSRYWERRGFLKRLARSDDPG